MKETKLHAKTTHKLSGKVRSIFILVLTLYLVHLLSNLFGTVQVFENWQEKRKEILQTSLNEWLNSYRANLTFASYTIKSNNFHFVDNIKNESIFAIKDRLVELKTQFQLDYVFLDIPSSGLIGINGVVDEKNAQKNRLFLRNFTEQPDFSALKATKKSFISFSTHLGPRVNGNSELYVGVESPIYTNGQEKVGVLYLLKKAQTMDDANLERMNWVVNLKSMQFLTKEIEVNKPPVALIAKIKQLFSSTVHELSIPIYNHSANTVIGRYGLVESTDEIKNLIFVSIKQGLLFFFILFTVLFYFYFFLRNRLLIPLAETTQVSAEVSRGKMEQRLSFMYSKKKKSWTEVEFFGEQFNHLLDGLSKKQHELSELNKSLEAKVKIRTRALTKANRSLHKQAYTDALTGVANRHSFEVYWGELLEKFIAEEVENIAVAIIDADFFKGINDTYGHHVGDKVLNIICQKIADNIGKDDYLVRLGGDEFAVLFTNISEKVIMARVKRMVESVQNFPSMTIGVEESLSISVGVAVCDKQNKNNAVEIIKHADTAMYVAKQNLKQKYVLFDKSIHSITEKELSHRSTKQILKSIETGEGLELLFQPVFNLKEQQVDYFELLSRFTVDGNTIYPNIFMQIIERTKSQAKFDKAVIKKAIESLASGRIRKGFGISINLSAESLLLDDVCSWFSGLEPLLKDYKIVIEVTETTMIKHLNQVSKTINTFKKQGFKVALDDFGNGYSSISYLAHLPVDIIKFDMSLTRAAFQKQRTAQLIEGLVKDLSAMDYDIVLEGIEDAEMFSMLSLMSPSHFQGYYINKPLAEPNYEIPEMSNKIKLI